MKPHDRRAFDDWRAQVLDSIDGAAFAQLDELVRNRLRLRRAGVWAAVALAQARQASAPQAAAQRAMDELAGVNKAELGDDEQAGYNEAAIRVSAVRWAAAHGTAPAGKLRVQLRAGEPGQTCVQLVPNTHASINANANANATAQPLAERCTYAQVWPASASPSADGRALALAVQPLDGWAELWVWRLQAQGWTLDVLPPASSAPGLGYVEFAGWVPGATPKLLLAREAKVEGRFSRRFEVLGGESLSTEKSASSPQLLAAFGQWASAAWKRGSVSLR